MMDTSFPKDQVSTKADQLQVFAALVLRIAQALEMEINPLVRDRNGLKVAH